jgi:hypothetical protein
MPSPRKQVLFVVVLLVAYLHGTALAQLQLTDLGQRPRRELRYQFTPGELLRVEMLTLEQMVEVAPDGPRPGPNPFLRLGFEFEVLDVLPSGDGRLKVLVTSAKPLERGSSDPRAIEQMAFEARGLAGTEVEAVLSDTGLLRSVSAAPGGAAASGSDATG